MVTKVTSVDGKLSEGSKVSSVRSLACGQATAPGEDEQGVQGGGRCTKETMMVRAVPVHMTSMGKNQVP